ncbi:MAG: hypothetical protein JRF65_02565, partial [Deltaproteobacteria bacterium]|nr:hypothetical protein [Deltaproteobacteria bacterium]
MKSKKTIDIHVNGYVCEIVCGQIPVLAREAVARHLIKNRDDAHIPEWMKKRYPSYVNPDAVKDLWYQQNDVMANIMKSCGPPWTGYRDVNGFCMMRGFGTGKGDMGLFDIEVFEEGTRVTGFVPFEPTVDIGKRLRSIGHIRQARDRAPDVPRAAAGHVAVSGGSWAKGTMLFSAFSHTAF